MSQEFTDCVFIKVDVDDNEVSCTCLLPVDEMARLNRRCLAEPQSVSTRNCKNFDCYLHVLQTLGSMVQDWTGALGDHVADSSPEFQETSAACQIKCMPTFQFYKNGEKVDEMSGADPTKLKELITKHK